MWRYPHAWRNTEPGFIWNNISGKRETSPIFRTISFSRFIELFHSKTNVLVDPQLWDDPFEDSLRLAVSRRGNSLFPFSTRYRVWSQSWSTKGESDAMWRIYSPDKKGIRIASTQRRLVGGVLDSPEYDTLPARWIVVGKVQYLHRSALARHLKMRLGHSSKLKSEDREPGLLADTYFIKRKAFSHEVECRIVVLTTPSTRDQLFRYSVNPRDLVTRIQLDPRLTQHEANRYADEIRKRTGYSGKIGRSELYDAPKRIVL